MDVLLEKVIAQPRDALGTDLEGFAQIALQRVDAGTAAMKKALHDTEKPFQVHQVIRLLEGIGVVNRSHERTRTTQAITGRDIGIQMQTMIQIHPKALQVKSTTKFLVLSKI